MKEQNDTNTPAVTKKNLSFKIEKQRYEIGDCWYGLRPLVKNIDILGDKYLGLPLEMLKKNKFFKSGKLQLGLYPCFGYPCKAFFINVSITDDTVIWKGWHEFNKAEYISAIQEMQKMIIECLAKHKKELKEYQKAVYEYLTQNMGIPATVAKSQIKFYEKWSYIPIEKYFMDDYSVQSVAKRIAGEKEI